MRSPVILLACLLVCPFTTAMAQSDGSNTDSVGNIYKTFIQQAGKEKVVLQTDRKIYLAGEKIWFKAFCAQYGIQSAKSLFTNNLFTDLVDDQDSVIAKLVLNNHELRTGGAFILPDSIRVGFTGSGAYGKILATDTNNIFIQPIYVLNKNLPRCQRL